MIRYAFAMMLIVALSNYLVQFPLNDWLTLAAFTYPVCYLITELTNRFYGPKNARKVVYFGFAMGVFLSAWLTTPKITCASGLAYLISQLLDISIFDRLRRSTWWSAPFVASCIASFVDTLVFWTIAFWGENLPILTWAIGDFAVKLLLDILLLVPFRIAIKGRQLYLN